MKHLIVLALSLSSLGALSCNGDADDDGNDTDTEALQPQIEGALGKANRPSPAPDARIDRAGRPAITAALISTFTPETRQADVDRYNQSGNANPAFLPIIEKSLGVLDGLDRVCGNQLLAGADPAARYRALARALNDDQLYVRSDRAGVSSVYLGVEAEAVDAVMPGQGSGGGRIPGDDVIARSYSVLVAGALSGLDDGVEQDDAVHDIDVFPFLAAPQQ
jgi:hypothetical protein